MSRVRFYVDEHIGRAVVDSLRRRGIDVLMPGDVNRRGYPDDQQLAFAAAESRVIVTKDPVCVRVGRRYPHRLCPSRRRPRSCRRRDGRPILTLEHPGNAASVGVVAR